MVIIWLLIGVPFFSNTLFKAATINIEGTDSTTVNWIISVLINPPLSHAIAIMEVGRLWLISYNLHYLHSSQNQQWKLQIDASFARKDWYLKNRNKFGNQRYVIPRMFAYYVLVLSLVMTSYIICIIRDQIQIAAYIDSMFYIFDLFCVFYIYFKCREHHQLKDNLLFHYEIKLTSIIWVGCAFNNVIVQIIYVAAFDYRLVADVLLVCTIMCAIVAPSALSTIWIARKVAMNNLWQKELLKKVDHVQMSVMNTDQEAMVNALNETLKNEEKFELFIQWMYREFSSEAGFCFIELVQFKESIVKFIQKRNTEATHTIDTRYIDVLYDGVPKSSIIQQRKPLDDISIFRSIAHELHNKYIKIGAEFEVNISHQLRTKYAKLDGKGWEIEKNEFAQVFERVILEMFLFMLQSFNRYQQHLMVLSSSE